MFHNAELLSWGSCECPVQMRFLESPLGTTHVAEMCWIFKDFAQLFPAIFLPAFFSFFFSAFILWGFLSAHAHSLSPNLWHVVVSAQKIFLQACFSTSVSEPFCSPDWCATNKFMPLPSKHCILWKWEEKVRSNENRLKRRDFWFWVRRIKENLTLIS